jgi:restriction endonuclease S subunit
LKSIYQEIRNLTGDNQRSGLNIPLIKSIKIPCPPLEVQQVIISEIWAEQELISANRELIARFEQKIQAVLARVWGEGEAG